MGTNLMQFKDDLSQNNWHVFVIFLIYNFRLLFAAAVYYFVMLRAVKKLLDFLFLRCFSLVPFTFVFQCCLKCYFFWLKNGNSVFQFRFVNSL